ncbi:hypothetical protein N7492_004536 [Penicillium capsulatum]|uniref:Uncharacterized protein n=1 Tax=Penicillium capsulatum TaxID=69766 RepID=A0A9W9IA47_9EURO|nr:hypothetical protein N7492_004536 [Penicillium capsulatum]
MNLRYDHAINQFRACRQRPPEPLIKKKHEGKSWWECKNLIGGLEVLFAKNPDWYTDHRKVDLGVRHLSRPLQLRWTEYVRSVKKYSWIAYCIFLARRLPCDDSPKSIRHGYLDAYQRQSERVIDVVLHLQRYKLHSSFATLSSHNECRHLYDRVLPIIQRSADHELDQAAWKAYAPDDLVSFAEFLQAVESRIPARINALKDRGVARKRARED